jgi:hypothetical protein
MVGQSRSAMPEPVLVTRLPAAMRRKVPTVTKMASLWSTGTDVLLQFGGHFKEDL